MLSIPRIQEYYVYAFLVEWILTLADLSDELFEKYGVRENQGTRAYRVIRDDILSGELRPGDRLNEATLAEAHGLSRTPVRSALTRLTSEGLVEKIPRVGWFVRKLSLKELLDVFGFWRALQAGAAARAAECATPEQVAELREVGAKIETCDSERDVRAKMELEERFHALLVEASGYSDALRSLYNIHGIYWRLCPQLVDEHVAAHPGPVLVTHVEIADAIASGDPRRALLAVWDNTEELYQRLKAAVNVAKAHV